MAEKPPAREVVVRAQPGPQHQLLASSADIAIFGGAAGGGKSMAIVLEPTRHVTTKPGYRGLFVRQTSPEIRQGGGLWDKSRAIYPGLGAHAREHEMEWVFPSGARVKMAPIEFDSDVHSHQGAEYAFIAVDEVTHFSPYVFWYLVGRLRTTCGVRPYLRATCNPDPDSFIAELISWWIDDDGYPIKERAAVLRYFMRDGEHLIWGNSKDDVLAQVPELAEKMRAQGVDPHDVVMSLTFIPSTLDDNPALKRADPTYIARLMILPPVERARLLGGNWKVRHQAGTRFQEAWFRVVDERAPAGARRVRYWDLAGSKRRRSDFTAGCLLAALPGGDVLVEDVLNVKLRPDEVEQLIKDTAHQDGRDVEVWIEEEKGAAGQFVVDHFARTVLPGFVVQGSSVAEGDKLQRSKPASSAAAPPRDEQNRASAAHGRVRVLRAEWTHAFLRQLEAFPDGNHDDMVDAFTGAFNRLNEGEFAWVSVRR